MSKGSEPPGADRAAVGTTLARTFRVTRHHRTIISVGWGLLCRASFPDARKLYIVADRRAWAHHGERFTARLAEGGRAFQHLEIAGGERVKSWHRAAVIADWLCREGARRRDLVVAFGGGTITDLVGFVSACYMRGAPYANVPTSLLAQVDASIGGKVAVNRAEAKNLLGAFHHPRAVLVDPSLTLTQPRKAYISGLAEAVKMAIIGEPDLFRFLEIHAAAVRLRSDPASLLHVVRESVKRKLTLIGADPWEDDLDRPLNLGHTLGHALESAVEYRRITHGEAVSMGIAAATRLSMRGGLCTPRTGERIIGLLEALGLPTAPPKVGLASLRHALETISLVRDGDLRFVVPVKVGRVRVLHETPVDDVLDALVAAHG